MVAPSIIYCLVSRGTVVFCEHTGDRGNFQQVTRTILEKIDATEDAKHSYSYDDCTFHMVVEHGIIYLAMSDKDFDRQEAFYFLDTIKTQFFERYSDVVATAVAFEMNKTFASVLTQQMDAFNAGPGPRAEAGARDSGLEGRTGGAGADKIEKVRGEIEEVKQVMTDNIDRILERGDKIELLVDKSLDLSEQVQPSPLF
eukprot:Tamp_17424.p1 GENE.Tamp_17424~~Tamp_17424.p1  ORF type:complete len:199 (-),score=49.70 Tamp_17424:514-1110(-)